jgi:methoxymalonate biosynthesis acyl carrier protein
MIGAHSVAERVRAFLMGTLRQEIGIDDDIFVTGMADSMFALELVTYVETTFGVELDGEDLERENFRSAAAIATLVARKVGSGAPAGRGSVSACGAFRCRGAGEVGP